MSKEIMLQFTGERIVPEAVNCEPNFAQKMYQEHLTRYLFAAQLCQGKSVIDLGCGVGYGSQVLARSGAASVLAMDLSAEAIEHAKSFYSHPAVTFRVENAEDFHVSEKVDVVVCFELIEHVERQRQVFRRIQRALKPDGVVIMSTPRALDEKRTSFHTHEFSRGEFEDLFLEHFADVTMYFENNHFISMIADDAPKSLDQITYLNDQFSLAQADYFIAIGRMSMETKLPSLLPVVAVNNDSYVTLLERDVEILHRAEDDVKEKLALASARLDEIEAELRQTREQSTGAIAGLTAEMADLGDQITHLTAERDDLGGRVTHLTAERDDLGGRVTHLTAERDDLGGRITHLAAEVADLGGRITLLTAERDDLVEKLSLLQDQLRTSRQYAEQLQVELTSASEAARTERENASGQINAIRTLLDISQREVESLRTELAAQAAEWGVREQRAIDVQADLQERLIVALRERDQIHAAVSALARVLGDGDNIDSLTASLRQLMAERDENAEAAARAASHAAELDRRLSASEHQRSEQRSEGYRLTRRVADLETELAHQSHVVQAMRASTSWRLSAPLRSASTALRSPRAAVRDLRWFLHTYGPRATVVAVGRKLTGGQGAPASAPRAAAPAAKLEKVAPADESKVHIGHFEPTSIALSSHVVPTFSPAPHFDVIMLIGCWEGESKRYRVYNVAEALEADGRRVKVHPFSDLRDLTVKGLTAESIVIFRSPYDDSVGVGELIDYAHERGIRLVFDIDDLVFDPDLVDKIHGVKALSAEEQDHYMDGVRRYRRLLLACDLVTVSTPPLARAVEAIGKPAIVIPNSLNRSQIDLATELREAPKAARERLTVGYFSGSRTHERDFAEAEGGLLRLMAERDDWDLLVVGFLELSAAWDPYLDRVRREGFVPYLEMMRILSSCDVNIAPLEIGDMFCEAKSELKYFEAALLGVPTVASPTEPFAAAIAEGETGFLARGDDAWADALRRLLSEPELRESIGRAACVSVIDRFGIVATAQAATTALLGEHAKSSSRTNVAATSAPSIKTYSESPKLKIDWIIPRLIIGGGGHRNILRAAHHLQSFGHDVALHFTGSDDQADQLNDLVRNHFYPFEGQIKAYDGEFRDTDVIFATHWTTVDAALRARDKTREIMYFVQDFEPAFAPMGSEYVLAENTYRQGLYCVTSGPWCEHMLRRDFGAEADHFRFPVDSTVYHERKRTKKKTNIVFFAKPEMPRRCFEIGAMALAHFHRARPDVEIIMFGSAQAKAQKVDFPATYLEVVPTINDLAQMYANADLGLVFSTTNPSLVPYEMMASGCPVVDLRRPGNELNYDGRQDIAYLADPIPEAMAREMVALLGDRADLASRRRAGLEFAATFPSEEEMAKRIETLIIRRMAERAKA